ncbi:therostasin [Aplysia californica]|uniref:Therostasin n=1 Tax=Aplysia californica TaxID=6500 RepID=A0ABM1ABH5_APLCA|nr:therostasin [Aplysia californica]
MKAVCFLALSCLLVGVTLTRSAKRGFCLSLCGDVNNVTCPDGYQCRSNGCGHQCYRTDQFILAPGCSIPQCEYDCPLGYVLDTKGCETCTCDYSKLQIGK